MIGVGTEPNSQVLAHQKLFARYYQYTLFLPQPFDEIERAYLQVITKVCNRSRLRGNKLQIGGRGPLFQNRIIGVQNAPGSLEQSRAVLGRQRDLRKHVTRRSRAYGCVVVI